MKRMLQAVCAAFVAVTVFVAAGCVSATTLISRGDNVGAIEKLASTLTRKPADQESADYFVMLYPSEVESRIQYAQRNVPDLINEWVASQGQSSLPAALAARKRAISTSVFLADDTQIQALISDMELTRKNLKELERIQRAVAPVPSRIGSTEVYYVEKYSNNFSGMSQIANRSMAEFYYELGNAAAPGANRSQKIALYDLYGKVTQYVSGYSNINTKRAESAFAVAEDYLAGSTVEEKKESITWFNRANSAVTNYNDANTRIRDANYQIGAYYTKDYQYFGFAPEKHPEYKLRSDMENAIKYFEASRGYRDAYEQIENCRKVLDYLNSQNEDARTADTGSSTSGTGGITITDISGGTTGTTGTSTTVTKNSILVQDTAKFSAGTNGRVNAAVTILAQGDLVLTANNVKVVTSTSGATVKSLTALKSIDSSFTKFRTRDSKLRSVSYTLTFELSKAGQFTFSIMDARGTKVSLDTSDGRTGTVSPVYSISAADYEALIPKTAAITYGDGQYSANSSEYYIPFSLQNYSTALSISDVSVVKNTTGGTVSVQGTAADARIVIRNISASGAFAFTYRDRNTGKIMPRSDGSTGTPEYRIELAKIWKPSEPSTPIVVTPVAVKPVVLIQDTAKFSQGTGGRVNADVTVLTQGELNVTVNSIRLVSNTAGAKLTSVSTLKTIDSSFTKFKTRDSKQKSVSYTLTFELSKAGQFSFIIVDAKGANVSLDTSDGRTGAISPVYSISAAEYDGFVPKTSAILYGDGQYSANSAEYYISFSLQNYSGPLSMNEINVIKNTTGGTVTVQGTASDARIVVRNMTRSGSFAFTYKDRYTGKVMPRADGGIGTPEYQIEPVRLLKSELPKDLPVLNEADIKIKSDEIKLESNPIKRK